MLCVSGRHSARSGSGWDGRSQLPPPWNDVVGPRRMDAYYEPNPSPAWRDSVRSEPWKDEGATGAGAPFLTLASSVPLAIMHAGAAVLNWHTHRSMKNCLENTANLVQAATASLPSTASASSTPETSGHQGPGDKCLSGMGARERTTTPPLHGFPPTRPAEQPAVHIPQDRPDTNTLANHRDAVVQSPSENDANADQETVGERAGVGTKIENQVCLSARARVTSEAQIGGCVQDLSRLTR